MFNISVSLHCIGQINPSSQIKKDHTPAGQIYDLFLFFFSFWSSIEEMKFSTFQSFVSIDADIKSITS